MRQERKFKVQFSDVKNGWMTVSLVSAKQLLTFSASYTTYDPISEYDFLSWPESESIVHWNEKPDEYVFVFLSEREKAEITVYEISQRVSGRARELVFAFSESHLQIALPFWRALRDLEANSIHNYEVEWRRQFPSREMVVLTEKLKQLQENRFIISK